MSLLSLSSSHLPGVVLISVAGELDRSNVGQLDAFFRQVHLGTRDHIVFDLTEVPFLDDSGLEVLINSQFYARSLNAAVHVAALSPRVACAIESAHVDHDLCIHTSVQEALLAAAHAATGEVPDSTTTRHTPHE